MGPFVHLPFTPSGSYSPELSQMANNPYLTNEADKEYLRSIMLSVTEPGKFANWIAPPKTGINRHPVDFEYVRHL